MRTGAAVATAGLILGTMAGPTTAAPAAIAGPSHPPEGASSAGTAAGDASGDGTEVRSRAVPATPDATPDGTPDGTPAPTGRVRTVAELAPVRTDPFALLGVTWAPGPVPSGLQVEVRVHTTAGWGDWQPIEQDSGHAPSAVEDAEVRAGTAPLWVGSADGVAVRLKSASAGGLADVQVVTVDPGPDPAATGLSAAGPLDQARPTSGDRLKGSPNFPQQPAIISRRQWGADRSLVEPCFSPRYGSMAKMVFVHHTAGANSYSARESPAIVRSILAYHTRGQNWCDIGYNALIDRFGNIYAGRRGGLRKPVRGAHAGDFNVNTVGVSLMGNFETAEPSRRIRRALVRFVGWRLGTSFTPVRGRVRVEGERFARISGHRDAMSTACPGRNAYDRLPGIRDRVERYLRDYRPAAERKTDRLGRDRTGPVFVGEQRSHGGKYTRFAHGRMYVKRGGRPHWLTGRVLKRYRAEDGVVGALGWPRSDIHRSSVGRARLISFKRGRMYVPPGKRIRELHGRVLDRYGRLGFARGRLGLPTSSIQRIRGGQKATFRGGAIRWDRSSDSFVVTFR